MALAPGTRLGAYEVVSLLGEGGMGQVYRAKDTRLKRDVALKILPDAFASDPDRVARFQREAELLATLNHPNIAAIYGLEQADGIRALVLELVEGPTLADRIAQGPIRADEALLIAGQIADALEAAHEKGVIHRDLKPANIKLTPDDTVKVLDFGLAKMLESPAAPATLSLSPTLSVHATYAGVILGTAAYMSPEQARGKAVDRRTDIWAFGCVLFEMLTGKPPFAGEDIAEVIGAIIHKDIAWDRLPASTPATIPMALARCLEKDPKKRIRDIGDVQLLLAGAFESPRASIDTKVSVAESLGTAAARLAAIAAALVVVAGAAAGITWAVTRPAPVRLQPVRFSILPPADQTVRTGNTDRDLAISPDGTHVAYVSSSSVATQGLLIVRGIDRLDAEPLRGITDARSPFWSPDSKWIGYFGDRNEIRKVSVTGGPPVTVCRTDGAPRGASWSPDGTIVFATSDTTTGLMIVQAGGGEPRVLTKPDAAHGERDHLLPSVLPDGRAVLFTMTGNSVELAQIAAIDLKTGARKILVRGASQAEYVDSGHLVYASAGTLRAVRFDAHRLEVLGDPSPIGEQVAMVASGAAEFSVSRTGTLLYEPGSTGGGAGALRTLAWVDRAGREEAIKAPSRAYNYPRLSPDGTKLAVSIGDQDADVWIWDFLHETLGRLTFDPAIDAQPTWTPDGRRVVFHSTRAGASNLFWQAADGTGTVERLTTSPNAEFTSALSPDGKSIVMLEQVPGTGNDIALFRLGGKPQPEPLLSEKFSETHPEISPDGRWLAYISNESGRDELYVRPFPNVQGGRWQISSSGASRPVWARNGKELFYGASEGSIVAVPVQTGATFSNGNPKKLFDWPTLGQPNLGRTYDVSADGKRFLMIKEGGSAGSKASSGPTLVVVLNWFTELQQRVPTR